MRTAVVFLFGSLLMAFLTDVNGFDEVCAAAVSFKRHFLNKQRLRELIDRFSSAVLSPRFMR